MPEASDRIDLTLVIESVDELYSGLAPRLCADGLFIETNDPAPAGSAIGFRVLLPDEVVLIQGLGTVVWTRLPGSIEGPAGMAVQFDRIDGDTRETIDAVTEAHLSTGGELFDLNGAGIRDVYPTDALDRPPSAGAGMPMWILDGELGEVLGSGSATRDPAVGARNAADDVVDLKFEEAIAGFTGGDEPAVRSDGEAIDQAISAAVVAPANGDDLPTEGTVEEPEEAASDGASADPIPDILNQWRDELTRADSSPEQIEPPADASGDATPWESLLPYSDDEHSLTVGQTQAVPTGPQSSTARRSPVDSGSRKWLWMVLPGALVVLLVWAGVLLIGGNGDRQPEAAAEPRAEAVGGAPAEVPVAGSTVDQESTIEAAVPAVAATAVPAATAARVRAIGWSSTDGATEVVIRGDGPFAAGQVDASRLTDPPRVLVRIRRIDRPYQPTRIEVGSPEVSAVRIGHHPELRPATLYVVLDLAAPTVVSTNALRVDRDLARVTVRTTGR